MRAESATCTVTSRPFVFSSFVLLSPGPRRALFATVAGWSLSGPPPVRTTTRKRLGREIKVALRRAWFLVKPGIARGVVSPGTANSYPPSDIEHHDSSCRSREQAMTRPSARPPTSYALSPGNTRLLQSRHLRCLWILVSWRGRQGTGRRSLGAFLTGFAWPFPARCHQNRPGTPKWTDPSCILPLCSDLGIFRLPSQGFGSVPPSSP